MNFLNDIKSFISRLWWLFLWMLALLACLAVWWYFEDRIERLKQNPTPFSTHLQSKL